MNSSWVIILTLLPSSCAPFMPTTGYCEVARTPRADQDGHVAALDELADWVRSRGSATQ
jgi:hypothetical protein